MRFTVLVVIVALGTGCAFCQTSSKAFVPVSVCDIVNNPAQFSGKLVAVRARIWMNYLINSPSRPSELARKCEWLSVFFKKSNPLAGSTAYATFTGRVVIEPTFVWYLPALAGSARWGPRPGVHLIVSEESDVSKRQLLNGPVLVPTL